MKISAASEETRTSKNQTVVLELRRYALWVNEPAEQNPTVLKKYLHEFTNRFLDALQTGSLRNLLLSTK